MKTVNKYLGVILLFLVALPALMPLLHGGFFVTDDADWMIIRFTAFHQALADGQFPVRFLPRLNFDYGYPVANFLYPGFMYFGEFFHLLKIGFIDSIKIVLAVSIFGSAFFCYLWLSQIFSRIAAFTGAVVYLYAPYHIYDLYVRGSVGEVLALALIPFLFWSIEKRIWPLFSIGIAGLVLSHNTLAALFLPLVAGYLLIKNKNKWKQNMNGLMAICLGIGLSSFFWFPALYDLRYTVFFQTQVSEWNQYFTDITLIGIFNAVVITAGVLLIPLRKYMKRLHEIKMSFLFEFFVASGVMAIFFSVQMSEFIWTFLPISFIQFPFRFLSVEIVAGAFLTAVLIQLIHKRKMAIIFSVIISTLVILGFLPFFTNIQYIDRIDGYYATNEDTTTVKKEYMPKWVKNEILSKPEKKIESEKAKITQEIVESNKITFTAITSVPTTVMVNTIYYPGWKAKINDKDGIITYDNPRGAIQLSLPQGEHQVKVYFTETFERMASNTVSLLSLLLLGIWIGKKYRYG